MFDTIEGVPLPIGEGHGAVVLQIPRVRPTVIVTYSQVAVRNFDGAIRVASSRVFDFIYTVSNKREK